MDVLEGAALVQHHIIQLDIQTLIVPLLNDLREPLLQLVCIFDDHRLLPGLLGELLLGLLGEHGDDVVGDLPHHVWLPLQLRQERLLQPLRRFGSTGFTCVLLQGQDLCPILVDVVGPLTLILGIIILQLRSEIVPGGVVLGEEGPFGSVLLVELLLFPVDSLLLTVMEALDLQLELYLRLRHHVPPILLISLLGAFDASIDDHLVEAAARLGEPFLTVVASHELPGREVLLARV
mmetsp:Transcript_26894/g.25953  ORF Transcript_26894/g.25953 Transcript_26894/m.25953 type:complete len:235 (-) Transcript_26894:241-945(-)